MSAHVFLSHSTADKRVVEELARRLRENEGIQVWLDKWNLIPGDPWQPAIEDALADSETCAVFIGPSGLRPWQKEEIRVAINRRVTDSQQRFRVMPVACLRNGGRLEIAQQIAAHESSRTTGLYDRRGDDVSLDEVELIRV